MSDFIWRNFHCFRHFSTFTRNCASFSGKLRWREIAKHFYLHIWAFRSPTHLPAFRFPFSLANLQTRTEKILWKTFYSASMSVFLEVLSMRIVIVVGLSQFSGVGKVDMLKDGFSVFHHKWKSPSVTTGLHMIWYLNHGESPISREWKWTDRDLSTPKLVFSLLFINFNFSLSYF